MKCLACLNSERFIRLDLGPHEDSTVWSGVASKSFSVSGTHLHLIYWVKVIGCLARSPSSVTKVLLRTHCGNLTATPLFPSSQGDSKVVKRDGHGG